MFSDQRKPPTFMEKKRNGWKGLNTYRNTARKKRLENWNRLTKRGRQRQ